MKKTTSILLTFILFSCSEKKTNSTISKPTPLKMSETEVWIDSTNATSGETALSCMGDTSNSVDDLKNTIYGSFKDHTGNFIYFTWLDVYDTYGNLKYEFGNGDDESRLFSRIKLDTCIVHVYNQYYKDIYDTIIFSKDVDFIEKTYLLESIK